jgi:hypothetical protein
MYIGKTGGGMLAPALLQQRLAGSGKAALGEQAGSYRTEQNIVFSRLKRSNSVLVTEYRPRPDPTAGVKFSREYQSCCIYILVRPAPSTKNDHPDQRTGPQAPRGSRDYVRDAICGTMESVGRTPTHSTPRQPRRRSG